MATKKFKRFSVCVDDKTYETLIKMSEASGDSLAEVSRKVINKGLAAEYVDESSDLIANIVRKQLEIVLKPHIERLAALSSKSGHMSATAAFLNVQALMDLVPKEQRKNVLEMYEKTRKKATAYMKTRTEDWDNKNIEK